MDRAIIISNLQAGQPIRFPADATSKAYAQCLDAQDPLAPLRQQFNIPTKQSLKTKTLPPSFALPSASRADSHQSSPTTATSSGNGDDDTSVYFCGNSLGCQPKSVTTAISAHLSTWSAIAVKGHFAGLENSPLTAWQDLAESVARKSERIVGAEEGEVVVMNTLTVNLHLLMASFYKPTETRWKIICEWRPFPSDYYAITSHLEWNKLDPATSLVQIQPSGDNLFLSTESILANIDAHASTTALLLLPGIQYYTGQLLDIPRITSHARAHGIIVGWDLAHAAGNVPLKLHDWDVDFAAWCTYKYLNAGPGAMGAAFIHERHTTSTSSSDGKLSYRPRLTGWYAHEKATRFRMDNAFIPSAGAAGFQLSNPSIIDLASLSAAFDTFNSTGIDQLREKSLLLTAYAEYRLDDILARSGEDSGKTRPLFTILTPRDPHQRGAQLSVLLREGLLEKVGAAFEEAGIVCDQRKPDVIRVAPVPLYNNFMDIWKFMEVFERALKGSS